MALAVLCFGDSANGRLLSAWVNEFSYAMGAKCDFDRLGVGEKESIVLSLVCLPPEWPVQSGTGRKGSGAEREFWSSARMDYNRFSARAPGEKLETIADALRDAIEQVPPRLLSRSDRSDLLTAIQFAIGDLTSRPERHPR